MSEPAGRLSAALADRYRIERELGQGGMATVYLAQDLRHDRQVAIKVLRPELAAVLGADRFVVEIKTTAALQHPHILPLFDSGSADGFLYYVMPYVEGETLRTKLDREKQLGVEEAVKITTEVADALDYAHRHGVIHRDIKPENILLHDGRPMVADFGIALAVSAAAGGRMTETGLSLGTPHYMSPEQATAEKEVTGRSDIYSLASVLYEMLAGQPPHLGGSAQQIIMKIIAEPVAEVTSLRKSVPANVAAALGKALEKLPADRFESAKAFGEALTNPSFATQAVGGMPVGRGLARSGRRALLGMAVITILAVLAAAWGWLRRAPAPPTSRFAIAVPGGTVLGLGSNIAVSRDGELLVFPGVDSAGTQRLWLKRAGNVDATPIAGTERGYGPFFSPDGSRLGFFHGAPRRMSVVGLAGGSPHVVTDSSVGSGGASWATDGFIYFDADTAGIQRIRSDGSDRQPVLDLDHSRNEVGFAWPEVLPGNRVLVARDRRAGASPENYEIVASRIGSNKSSPLTKGVLARAYGDHLFVASADGTLRIWKLNAGALALRGSGTVVATGLRVVGVFAAVDLTVDAHGTLYYGAGQASLGSLLEWVDSAGHRVPADSTWQVPWVIVRLFLSPDGRRVMVSHYVGGLRFALWIKQLPVGPMIPFAAESLLANNLSWTNASWTPDGHSILTSVTRGGGSAIYRQRADGLGARTLVVADRHILLWPEESRDGRWLVAGRRDSTALPDVVAMRLGRDTVLRPLIATPAAEGEPALSPDGHWLAYVSGKSGRFQVYVQPFPDVNAGIWQVSIRGGEEPVWSPAGDRLYFRRADGSGLFAVDITTRPAFHAGLPHQVLGPSVLAGLSQASGYAISPDGKRILMVAYGRGYRDLQLVRVEHVMSAVNRGGGQ